MALLVFFLILSVLVLVHELGHFLMAKRFGILVEEFGFGLPPRIWGKKIGETIYSINWLPIGGFVKLYGEDPVKSDESDNGTSQGRAFWVQTKRVRLAVLAAGVVMNFLLGVVLFGVIYSRLGVPTETEVVKVVGVAENSPAAAAGIKVDEVIVAMEREPIRSTERFIELIRENRGKRVEITLGEKGKEHLYGRMVTVMLRDAPPEEGALGVVISDTELKHFAWWQMPFRGAWIGLKEAIAWGETIVVGLVGMVSKLVISGEVPRDVAGPVGIFQLTSGVAQAGTLAVLQFMGVLSINLAVLNLLPLPALDGGRLVFVLVEVAFGKKLRPGWEKMIHAAGMAILLALMLLVTVNDVVRLTNSGSILGLVQKVWPF